MKYAFRQCPIIRRRLKSLANCLFLFDFDGTLAPIVGHSRRAALSPGLAAVLSELKERAPVAVVSGRALADIKKRIKISGLIYAGNHGGEWQIGRRQAAFIAPPRALTAQRQIKRRLRAVVKKFPLAWLEDKRLTLSLHYRLAPPNQARQLLRAVKTLSASFKPARLWLFKTGKKVVEVVPREGWNKGRWAAWLVKEYSEQRPWPLTAVYVGDDRTDEDAFKILRRGVTIRVGKAKRSAAQYFLNSQAEVGRFLEWLLSLG